KRPAVNEGRIVLQRLHQVGHQRVLEQHGHGAVDFQVGCRDFLAVTRIGHDDCGQTLIQVVDVGCQTQYSHDFGRHRNVEPCFAWYTVAIPERHYDVAQGAVVHVHDPAEGHAAGIDVQGVALMNMIVDRGCQQIVGHADGMHITGKVQVDVFHGHDLRIATSRGAAFHAENRPHAGFAGTRGGLDAHMVECVG